MWSAHDKYSAFKKLEQAWEEVSKLPTATPCVNCLHFSAGYCNLWKDAVPKETLPVGCEKFNFDPESPPF